MKTLFIWLFLSLAIIHSPAAAEDKIAVVEATFQDRTYFSTFGADVRIAFVENSITTLVFRVYDGALLDTPCEKGAFDGKTSARPHIDSGADLSNAYRDSLTLTIGTPNTTTIGTRTVVPLYQTKDGHRLYYIVGSFRETTDNKRFSFLVQQPAAK